MANNRPTIPSNPIEIIEALDSVTAGLGDWVANGTPSNPIASAIQQRYRDACDSYSNGLQWTTALSPQGRSQMGNLCDPWLQSQGSGSPGLESPFTGGQCEGVEYSYVRRLCVLGNCNNQTRFALGPIGPVQRETSPGTNGRTNVRFFHQTGSGELTLGTVANTENPGDATMSVFNVQRTDGLADTCGDPPGEPIPNPNPRPDPGLPGDEEPFDDPSGRPVIPMPGIPDPFGDPIQLPNFPFPPLFQSPSGGGESNPNVGPPVTPGAPQGGAGSGNDDDFPDPPEGHQWVGFVVELSDQGVTEGLQPNSPPHPIYRSMTGNYRAKYSVDGQTVYSTPWEIRQQTSTYWLDLAGLTLTGARVNVPGNDSYSVTPLSQPKSESEPAQV